MRTTQKRHEGAASALHSDAVNGLRGSTRDSIGRTFSIAQLADQFGIQPTPGQQFLVPAALDDQPGVHDQDLVGVAHHIEPMSRASPTDRLPLIMFHIMFQLSGIHTVEMLTTSVSEHRRIARAILDGDAATAEAEIRAHLTRAAEVTRDMPPSIFRP